MQIRDATPSDVAAMYAADHMATEEGRRRQQIRDWVSGGKALVAVIDDVVVGYAVLDYSFFDQGFISMLMVRKESRRQGIATALIGHLEGRCKTAKLFTSTNESNEPMRALLQTMSYEPSGVVHNLDDGDPELFFVKRVDG